MHLLGVPQVTIAKPIPLWDFGSPAAVPFGLPMCQNRAAIPTWSFAMERLPPARIIEIGTFAGGFATALALHASQIGAPLITYDLAIPNEKLQPLAESLGVRFRVGDMWTPELTNEIIQYIQSPGTTFLLCDGGNKPREMETFAPYLKPGDVIASHDYAPPDGPRGDDVYWPCGEITLEHGQKVAAANGLSPWMQEHFDIAAWLVYRKD